ncbi:MAG: MFS transporter, partial [Caulobacteraceae bacterium]
VEILAPSGSASRAVPISHIVAVSAGNALDFYDFITYALFAIYIGRAFFPSHSASASLLASLATFGVGFLARPIGGLVLGSVGDRFGRRPAMLLTFGLMGLGMLGVAATPPAKAIGWVAPALLILFRLIQGFALGGQVGPSTAYLLEAAPEKQRAFYTSLQAISQQCAVVAGSAIGLGITLLMPAAAVQAYGWRIVFFIGVAIVPYGLWVLAKLPETLEARPPKGASVPVATAMPATRVRDHKRILAASFIFLVGGTMSTYATNYLTTWAMDSLHMDANVAFGRTVLTTLIGIVAIWIGARLADRFGRAPLMIWPLVAALVLSPIVFLFITRHPSIVVLFAGTSLLAAIGPLCNGASYATMVDCLPPQIRSAAFGTVYALAIGIFGGATQFVIKWLINITHRPMMLGWYLTGAIAVSLVGVFLFPNVGWPRLRKTAAPAAADRVP